MPIQCPTCSKVNPDSAAFCYYDGGPLYHLGQAKPAEVGTASFKIPFCFSDGQGCTNFNQLALACDTHWNEAKRYHRDGTWAAFFGTLGRADLAITARQTALEADTDTGLATLIERLPTDSEALRPKLGLVSDREDLGKLQPGVDLQFEMVITNAGMLVLRGSVMTDCEWLSLGTGEPSTMKLFQTRDTFHLTIRVLGSKLRAMPKPLLGRIIIDSNGGRKEVPIQALVPVQAFPWWVESEGILTGVKSPRDLARKVKDHPDKMAAYFDQGAIRQWYESNGWAYPIKGTQGKGRAAIQQYFEALGLVKAPRLEIDTESIECQGKAGQTLTQSVTISTTERKLVTAEALCDEDWITAQPEQVEGNKVTIPLRIKVPPCPGQIVQTNVVFQGNGQQRFVVPVTLTIAEFDPEDDEDYVARRDRQRQILVALGGGVLILTVFLGLLAYISRGKTVTPSVPDPEIVKAPENPNPNPDAWWQAIPGNKLEASVAKLKEAVPAEVPLFLALADKDGNKRYKAYEQFGQKLPELVRLAPSRDSLQVLVTECCALDPDDLTVPPLLRVVVGQFPGDGIGFRPSEKGAELERAVFWQKVCLAALKHNLIRPGRSEMLAMELGKVFGFYIDITTQADDLEKQVERLLAVRCYRNLVATANESIEHALAVRSDLLTRYPQHLSGDFVLGIDVALLAELRKQPNQWQSLEPIFKTCTECTNLSVSTKIVDLYAKVDTNLAKKMEPVLAIRWKEAANAELSHQAKVAAIRQRLLGEANRAKITPAERLAQLQKLTDAALVAVKTSQDKEDALLQDAVRLTHAATMAALLSQKADEAFDELVGKIPGIETTQGDKTPKDTEPKKTEEKSVVVVGKFPYVSQGAFTNSSDRDPKRGSFRKVYSVTMKVGHLYTIDLISSEFNSFLRLETPGGTQLATDDDSGGFPHARISYAPNKDGEYHIVATTADPKSVGKYTVAVQESDDGLRGNPFAFKMRRPGGGVQQTNQQVTVQPENSKQVLPLSDLADLGDRQSTARVTALQNLAGKSLRSLPPRHAQKIAKYLLVTMTDGEEFEAVNAHLKAFATASPVLQALEDLVANGTVTQQRTEVVIGGILGQRLQFARDEDWRLQCRKLLLEASLAALPVTGNDGDRVAEFIRELYKEQGQAFGLEDREFLAQTSPVGVLEGVIKHVAARVVKGQRELTRAEKEFLEQIDRQLQAARFVADNDLVNVALLQRVWIKVLSLHLQERLPEKAKAMSEIQQELAKEDGQSSSVVKQIRAGEEKILRIWQLGVRG